MAKRKQPPARQKVRRTLTMAELERCRPELEESIRRSARQWGSHGWAIVGAKRALRVEIAVAKTLLKPVHPIAPIELRSLRGALKPAVRASLDGLSISAVVFPESDPAELLQGTVAASVSEPLAPGSRIVVTSSTPQRAGVACIVEADGDLYLVTCGHVFEPGASSTAVYTLGRRVATLTHNFLEEETQLDAACCKLTGDGRQLLALSVNAPTWFDDVLAAADGHGREGVFWPTNDAAADAITTTVNSYCASESHLVNDYWQLSLDELIRTEQITVPGDSGALLAVDDQYYGSCTGSPSWSYFTPLAKTMERLRERFNEVNVWQPG